MTDNYGRMTNPTWIGATTDGELPKYQTSGSAGCDLTSAEDVTIPPQTRRVVGTGLKIEMPGGYGAYVCPRSGLAAKHGVTVLNTPGVIDNDYRGEIKVILYNSGEEEFIVKKGDRIAQLVFFPIIQAIFRKIKVVASTDRGEGGFGSTGR